MPRVCRSIRCVSRNVTITRVSSCTSPGGSVNSILPSRYTPSTLLSIKPPRFSHSYRRAVAMQTPHRLLLPRPCATLPPRACGKRKQIMSSCDDGAPQVDPQEMRTYVFPSIYYVNSLTPRSVQARVPLHTAQSVS